MFPQISVRVNPNHPNHHIWNNNGTWFIHYVIHPTPLTKKRVRVSLGTKDVDEARRLRDIYLADIYREEAITEVLDYRGLIALRARQSVEIPNRRAAAATA